MLTNLRIKNIYTTKKKAISSMSTFKRLTFLKKTS